MNFRRTAWKAAERLGVVGSVRNLADGTVEVVGQGSRELLEAFLGELERRPGVSGIETVWSTPAEIYRNFEIRYD